MGEVVRRPRGGSSTWRRAPTVPVATESGWRGRTGPRIAGAFLGVALPLALATPVAAHNLTGRYASPLPLAVYLAGAAIAVGLSFAFVLLRTEPSPMRALGPVRQVPVSLRMALRVIGLAGWAWIVAQTIVGDAGDADVASLFLWVYGWVGVALVSAFVGPVWRWLDPFTTLHDLGAAVLARLGVGGWRAAPYPAGLAHWPAVVGFGVFVWLELAFKNAAGGRNLGVVMLAYTAITLAAMAQYGRDEWRARGETFSVWFGTLGRLARYAPDDPEGATVRRQPLGAGLVVADWDVSRVVLVGMAAASIIYDGLSQTKAFLDVFGVPGLGGSTLTLVAFVGLVVAAVLLVARIAGLPALGAGLLPIAVGYLIAHYLTYLLGDGQRIVVALSDPLGRGWDLLGLAAYEPGLGWLPSGAVWAIQVVAVVSGHVVGAWAGHEAAMAAQPLGAGARDLAALRRRQVPLAALMVGLTVLTLWSLGQVVVQEPTPPTATGAVASAPATGEPAAPRTWTPMVTGRVARPGSG